MNDAIHHLVARQAVHDALLRYARGLDRLDVDLVASAYHEDGIDNNGCGGVPVSGTRFATETVEMLRSSYVSTSHLIHNTLVEVSGEVARSKAYYTAWHRFERNGRLFDLVIAGRYLDRFERRGGVWKIAARSRVRDWSRVDPVLETHDPAPGWLLGLRSREDAGYDALRGGALSGPTVF